MSKKNIYTTKVKNFSVDEGEYLGIEVPPEFIEDLELVDGEILEWEIDRENKSVQITKTNFIDK